MCRTITSSEILTRASNTNSSEIFDRLKRLDGCIVRSLKPLSVGLMLELCKEDEHVEQL
jgi:hypothetical protein